MQDPKRTPKTRSLKASPAQTHGVWCQQKLLSGHPVRVPIVLGSKEAQEKRCSYRACRTASRATSFLAWHIRTQRIASQLFPHDQIHPSNGVNTIEQWIEPLLASITLAAWLTNRDPYNDLLQSPSKKLGSIIPLPTQTTKFFALLSLSS